MIEIDLTDSVVVLTGAAGGIGRGIADRFAAAGAMLVLQHHRSGPPTAAGAHVAVRLDVTDTDAPTRLLDAAVASFGRADVLVNNAGVQPIGALADLTDAEWAHVLDVDLTAAHRLTTAFARHVADRDGTGCVVHIASIEGIQPAHRHGHYAVAKAGLLMHVKAAAIELGPRVRVNAVSPGLIVRKGLADDWPDGVTRWTEKAPLGRLGEPADVGDACVFLASPLARWITGSNLVVDGGMSARPTW